MNRKAKRNKYKRLAREAKSIAARYNELIENYNPPSYEPKSVVETICCVVPINTIDEYMSFIPKEEIERERQKMTLDHFSKYLMERPDLLHVRESDSFKEYSMKVVVDKKNIF